MSVSRPWESGCRGLNFQRLLRSLAGPIQAFGSAGGFVLSRSAARHTAAHERVRQHYGDVDGRPCPAPALSDGHDSMMEMPAATSALLPLPRRDTTAAGGTAQAAPTLSGLSHLQNFAPGIFRGQPFLRRCGGTGIKPEVIPRPSSRGLWTAGKAAEDRSQKRPPRPLPQCIASFSQEPRSLS